MNRFALFVVVLVSLAAGALATEDPAPSSGPTSSAQETTHAASAPLEVWNRHITDFRATYEQWDAAERARRAVARILAVPAEQSTWVVARQPMKLGDSHGVAFSLNGEFVFRLLEADIDAENGESLEQMAQKAETNLREVMDSRVRQRKWPLILRGAGISLALTLALGAALMGAWRVRRRIQERFAPILSNARQRAVVGSVNLWPILAGLRQLLARIVTMAVAGGLVYLWLALVLKQFPYTEPWGDALGGFVAEALTATGWGILSSIPGLFLVVVIFALAHAFAHGLGSYFLAVEREEVSVVWLGAEMARATRMLVTVVIWGFALVLAYPHIPGSDSDAFKGVSVFVGLMISLGSAGLVNHMMSGLTVIYSNAYHHGDYVKIGQHEGRVQQVGLLSTKIVTPGGEVVSLPNAVVTATTTTNCSPGGREVSEILATSVTIGYDAPWRQVHALLQLAAKRTPQLAQEPAPFVLQRSLSDFYVEYQLVAHAARSEQRAETMTRLLGAIQDAFNEHGVQIMSPHFMNQPAESVLVPRSSWFTTPAAAEDRQA